MVTGCVTARKESWNEKEKQKLLGSLVTGPDQLPPRALAWEILASTVFGKYFWQTVYSEKIAAAQM